jgi:ADP-ribosylglycohydrolase
MNDTKWPTVIRGCAYGDAWGHKNEFLSYQELVADHPKGPDLPEKLVITDDTQMTLYLARALDGADADQVRSRIPTEFTAWLVDPENWRAPGGTCLGACKKLHSGLPWHEATVTDSDGCGAVMRVSPTAFLHPDRWVQAAAYQAAVTHGSFTGITAAVITAHVIRNLETPGTATEFAYHMASEGYEPFLPAAAEWITDHPLAESQDHLMELLAQGFQTCAKVIEPALGAVKKFQANPWAEDPCLYGGEGWRSPDCLATALLSVDTFPDDPVSALRRATVTNGDSDSIAAVAGAILGAVHDDPWPAEWEFRLEPAYIGWIRQADHYRFA